MQLAQYTVRSTDQTFILDLGSAHAEPDPGGEPHQVLDAWEVHHEAVAYFALPTGAPFWDAEILSAPVRSLVREVIESKSVEYWRERVGERHGLA